jgi:hypothetical protein
MTQQAFAQVHKQAQVQKQAAGGILQRKCSKCREKEKILQCSAFGPAPETAPSTVHEVLRSPGQPPDVATRAFMEPRFGHDFSQVPVHSRLLASIQGKLTINVPGDIYEQEADRVADQVMATRAHAFGSPPLQIQRLAGSSGGQMEAPASVGRALASPGRPLPAALRQDMERGFGYDFSGVRVHTGMAAEQSARDLNAKAYTLGHNIAFDAGRFAPGTHEGSKLIAHELAHVVQQSSTGIRIGQNNERRDSSPISAAQRIQRKDEKKPDKKLDKDPVIELKQIGDKWQLKLRGITDVKAAKRRIWSSKTPPGVKITLLAIEEKPEKTGLFELSGITLQALKTMNSPFESWFEVTGISWTADDLKKMLDACDGGLGIWAKAKKANGGKVPKITLGQKFDTDSSTGEITLDSTTGKCHAVQALIHELTNLVSLPEVNKVIASAAAGDLSRDQFIRGIEKIEYDFGVKNVLAAYNACKDKWLCKTNIMDYASKAKDFEDYFKNLLKSAHKESYGKEWDDRFKKAYEKKHPTK